MKIDISAFEGLIAVFTAALIAFLFNSVRDFLLRRARRKVVASAVAAEVELLMRHAARMAERVANRYFKHGIGRQREGFDEHFFAGVPMPSPTILGAIITDVGLLPHGDVRSITEFYGHYEDACYWLPMLREVEGRPFSYAVSVALKPAISTVESGTKLLLSLSKIVPIEAATDYSKSLSLAEDLVEQDRLAFEEQQ